MVGLLAVVTLTVLFALQPASPAFAQTASSVTATGLGYNPLAAPVRIADTRSGATDPSTYAGKTLSGSGATLTVDVPSSDVPAGAGAIVAQLTAITPTASGYLSIYPAGEPFPGTANVLFVPGEIVGNLVTVGLGSDPSTGNPAVTIYNGAGSTDFTLDLYGYYAPANTSSGDTYQALVPARIYDSRSGSGEAGAGTTLGPGGSDNVTVVGVGGIPADAAAVVLNVAVTNTTAPSYIQCYPNGSPPSSSTPTVNQNFGADEILSTQVVLG
ncbi:MAG: hypothetical protein ACRD6W_16225, partial [Nitrososphaerales archaeon]